MKLRRADIEFSKAIKLRDAYCLRCYTTEELDCSHFYGRARESTRFDLANAVALCRKCHGFWGHGKGRAEYTRFMQKRLGESGFKELTRRAFSYRKKNDKEILNWLKT